MKSLQIKQSITDRSDTALKAYLKEVNKYPLLTVQEEKDLGHKVKNGDKEAFNKLVVSNLRFVISVAKQYQNQGVPLIDLIQEGNIGLMEAINKWDVDKGFKFISYAVWWIRQKIVLALSNKSRTIRIPTSQLATISKVNKVITEFEAKNERKPSNTEIAKLTGINVNKIPSILSTISKMVSLDSPITGIEDGTLIDIVPNKEITRTDATLLEESNTIQINKIISKLNPRDQDIIRMYFGIGCDAMTLDRISDKFGLTNERTRQVKDKAIKTLRDRYGPSIKEILNGKSKY